MSANELIKSRPELFDGYDGKDRTPDQQRGFDAYHQKLLADAPDYIKQAIAERERQPRKS